MIILDFCDMCIVFVFSGGNGVLFILDVKKLCLLVGKFQLVLVVYIKISVGDCVMGVGGWFGEFCFEIYFYGVLFVLIFVVVLLVIYKVVVIVIYFVNCGLQVMYIVFYFVVDWVFSVVFLFVVLLVLVLMIELSGGDNVFLFNVFGVIFVFMYFIVVGFQVYDVFFILLVDLVFVVKVVGCVGIDFDVCCFGLRKIVNVIGQGLV